jgi:hypothetical protein
MKSFIEQLKKYKLQILFLFLLIFFFRSCGKSRDLRKIEKIVETREIIIDRLPNQKN